MIEVGGEEGKENERGEGKKHEEVVGVKEEDAVRSEHASKKPKWYPDEVDLGDRFEKRLEKGYEF